MKNWECGTGTKGSYPDLPLAFQDESVRIMLGKMRCFAKRHSFVTFSSDL